MNKRLVKCLAGFLLVTGSSFHAFSQQSHNQRVTTDPYGVAMELYLNKNFGSAYQKFEQLAQQKHSIYQVDASFYKALSALELKNKQGIVLMEKFLSDYSDSKYESLANLQLGMYHFSKKKLDKAKTYFDKAEAFDLDEENKEMLLFHQGVCALEEGKSTTARKYFSKLEDENSEYYDVAQYYLAHIAYEHKDYDSAFKQFNILEEKGLYAEVIAHYIAQMYYQQKQYDKVISYAKPLLDQAEGEHRGNLARLVGNAYYMKNEYAKALSYHKIHRIENEEINTESQYIYGYCNYKLGKTSEAIKGFEQAARGEGAFAQNGSYHLAKCYITKGDKKKALQAFRLAADASYDEHIEEDALFNFAKLSYELEWSPFSEAIKAFDEYITKYPNTDRNTEAYDYLVQVFLTTENYKDALSTLGKIEVKNKEVKRAYQRVAYYRGLELYKNGELSEAIALFDRSLKYGYFNDQLKGKAYYWKAESQYQLESYKQSIATYHAMMTTPSTYSTQESKNSNYGLGYAYFKLEDYQTARGFFEKYIRRGAESRDKLSDSYNRIGDCYFIDRNFDEAVVNYSKTYSKGGFDADYALFQLAFCAGLQRNQHKKINELNRLLQEYPDSKYADDALFEQGRAWERLSNRNNAIAKYETILSDKPTSSYVAPSLLQLGLIHYSMNSNKNSLTYFKELIDRFPNSEEAGDALNGIKNNYIDMNEVDKYLAYTKRLGKTGSVSASEQDSLTFIAAERQYMAQSADAKQSLRNYLGAYPNGAFVVSASYYLGDLYKTEGNVQESRVYLQKVVDAGTNIFTEQALSSLSVLVFNEKEYENALPLFLELDRVANQSYTLRQARLGIMRCHVQLQDWEEAARSAEKVRLTEKITESDKNEATYTIATALRMNGDEKESLSYYKELSEDVKNEYGAEAKYWVCQILYNEKHLPESEQEVMAFIEMNTPHQKWLGKSFLVLANIYHKQKDDFQAEYTLKSLIENYESDTDGVKKEAQALLDSFTKDVQTSSDK